MLNWPVADGGVGRPGDRQAAPWALLVVPVGAVTVMVSKAGPMAAGLIGTAAMAQYAEVPAVQLMVTEPPVACLVLAAPVQSDGE